MKRVIALVLAMLMMLSLVACGQNATEPTESIPPKPETPIEIKVAVAQCNPR